ncbi:glycosyltransferase [Synechococcus sp. PCC 6716]|nr:glycosyltransferase [Synechococcus sp. PCC 6716]
MLEPLGQSQVLRYLEGLSSSYEIYILSFEKSHDWNNDTERDRLKKQVSAKQIHWIPLKYHKSPTILATSFDILQGLLVAFVLIVVKRIKIIHARSYVPSIIALALRKILGVKFIFDMRGFWADERVDADLWAKDSWLYLTAKWFEKQFLLSADSVVSLTKAAIDEINKLTYLKNKNLSIVYITTCTDLNLFNINKKKIFLNKNKLIVGYVGSASGWYLFDKAVKFFKHLQNENSNGCFFKIINKGEHHYIIQKIEQEQINPNSFSIESALPSSIPQKYAEMHLVIFFIKPAYSKIASSPTKLGELLACGLPCVTNDGIGDMTEIIETEKVGVVLRNFDDLSMVEAVNNIIDLLNDSELSKRCRYTAEKYFSLEEGIEKYKQIYSQLENKR